MSESDAPANPEEENSSTENQPESFTDIFYALTAAQMALSYLNGANSNASGQVDQANQVEEPAGFTVEFMPEEPSTGQSNSIRNASFEIFVPGSIAEPPGNYPVFASAAAPSVASDESRDSRLIQLLASINSMVDRANSDQSAHVERCSHAKAAHKSSKAANLIYCIECHSVLIRNRHSDSFRTLPLPSSMLRDARVERLLAIYTQCCEIDTIAQDLLYNIERLQCCLNEWRHKYVSNSKPVDFNGQNSFLYLALEQVLAVQTDKIRSFADQHHTMHEKCAVVMQTAATKTISPSMRQFLRNTKLQISAAHPEPIYYPNCGHVCSICCEQYVYIRLHNARHLAANRPSSRSLLMASETKDFDCQSTERAARSERRLGQRAAGHNRARETTEATSALNLHSVAAAPTVALENVCQCADFSVCIDCLLQSYWHSTEALKKSFANCPTCRAEYQLEDIIPVYNGKPIEKAAASSSDA